MNRLRFLMAFLLLAAVHSNAQPGYHLLYLRDKQHNSYSVNQPQQFLSNRALQRRTKQSVIIDSTDLPVSAFYLNQLKQISGVQVINSSKWLNAVLIYTTDFSAANSAIQSLPFVIYHNRAAKQGITSKIKSEICYDIPASKASSASKSADQSYYGYSFDQINIHEGQFLHKKGFKGEGILIAMLDAGYHKYNSIYLFDSLRIKGLVAGEKDFVDFDDSTTEDDAHGRNCLGVMAANVPGTMVGTAPNAAYWLIRTEDVAIEMPVEEYNWVVGAEFADSAGVDLITSSLGYNLFDDASLNHSYADFYNNVTIISKGASMAVSKGMIVTNSAGNEGNNGWKYLIFPADASGVCAVGATNIYGQPASFSSYGYPGKIKPNITSVGWGTYVAGLTGPVMSNGTSFSNPNIAGLIACLWQAFPEFKNTEILDAVYRSSDRYLAPDSVFGYGLPNMRKAYMLLKQKQNEAIYGSEWLKVAPLIFDDTLHIQLIAQTTGNALIELVNQRYETIRSKQILTEELEVYDFKLDELKDVLPGKYFLKYSYGQSSRSIEVIKKGIDNNASGAVFQWHDGFVYVIINPLQTGKCVIQLSDMGGRTIETMEQPLTAGSQYVIKLNKSASLQKGVYNVTLRGAAHETFRFLKQ